MIVAGLADSAWQIVHMHGMLEYIWFEVHIRH